MLIRSIEKFLKEHDMPPTKFGRLAAHDPRFVLDLRNGRSPREDTTARVEKFMRSYHSEVGTSELTRSARKEPRRHG
jgi:predicted transcriptional regulator